MGELFLHAFQDISQVSIADVLKIRLVVDIEELQFVSDNADAEILRHSYLHKARSAAMASS